MVRVRFAPSPTGIPHIGNTRTALFNYLFAKHHHGQFILRIEDTDVKRLVPGSLEKILEILKFVNINWDEGPYIQSKRLPIYQDHAQQLIDKHAAYYCFCTGQRLATMRQQQQQQGQPPKYDRLCLKLSPAQIKAKLDRKTPYVVRLKTPQTGQTSWQDLIQNEISFDNRLLDDQVLLKSDGYPTYHLAVVIDDHLMNISHILRGVEWISSTPKHLLIYKAFAWPIPQIGHFPVILGSDKAKLSKRHGAKSALDYRDAGYLPQALVTFMAYLGWSYQDNSQLLTLNQLIKLFDLKKVQPANPIFDLKKLDYFNAKLIRQTPTPKLIQLIKPFLTHKLSAQKLKKIIPLIQERLVTLAEANQLIDYFIIDPQPKPDLILSQSRQPAAAVITVLNQTIQVFSRLKPSHWQAKTLEQLGHDLLTKTGWSPKQLFMTLRVILTAKIATPPLFEIMAVLGKPAVIKRFNHAQKILKK